MGFMKTSILACLRQVKVLPTLKKGVCMIVLNVASDLKFSLGQIFCTSGVSEICAQINLEVYLARHQSGDWGDLCSDDWEMNEQALDVGDRLFSSYRIDTDEADKLWIITEWDRSVTTILLPHEY